MTRKYYFIIVVLAMWCLRPSNGSAEDMQEFCATIQATNGLVLGVVAENPDHPANTIESPMGLLLKAPSNTRSILFIPKEEYLLRMELYDLSNNPVSKTVSGLKYGVDFNDIYWDIEKFAKSPHSPCNVSDGWSWAYHLPSISKLFVVTKSGEYRLRLELQVMVYYLDTTQKQTRKIFCFPPVDIKLTKTPLKESVPSIDNKDVNSPAKIGDEK